MLNMQIFTDVKIDVTTPLPGMDNVPTEGGCLINDLPRELLLKLFKICQLQVREKENLRYRKKMYRPFGKEVDHDRREDAPRPPFELLASHVCKFWRNSILSDPSFWTTLDFDEPMPFPRTQTYLNRSQYSPLDVVLYVREPYIFPSNQGFSDVDHGLMLAWKLEVTSNLRTAINLILPHAPRWQLFKVDAMKYEFIHSILLPLSTVSSAPLLKTFRLEASAPGGGSEPIPIPFAGQTPLLVNLQLSNVMLEWEGSIGFFRNLHSLKLQNIGPMNRKPISLSLFRQMLAGSGSSHIKNLVLCNLHLQQSSPSEIPSGFTLPNLQTLLLGDAYLQGINIFLNSVNAPSLRDLQLLLCGPQSQVIIDEVGRGLLRPLNKDGETLLPSVETLRLTFIGCDPFSDAVTMEFFKQLGRLQTLILNLGARQRGEYICKLLMNGSVEANEATDLTTKALFCSRLEHLLVLGTRA